MLRKMMQDCVDRDFFSSSQSLRRNRPKGRGADFQRDFCVGNAARVGAGPLRGHFFSSSQYLFFVDPNNSKKLVCLGLTGGKKGNELWKAELSKAIEKLECALPNSMIKVWPAQTVLDMSNGKILGEDTIRQRVEAREAVMEAMRKAEREAMRQANPNLPDKK
jgi:hypothetical protein